MTRNEGGAPVAVAPDAPAAASHEPLRLDLNDSKPRAKIPTKRYWIGMLLGSPVEGCSRGGVSFQKIVGPLEFETDGSIKNPAAARLGEVVELTDDQLKVALERIASTVVRTTRNPVGKMTSARLVSTKWRDVSGNWVADVRHDPMPGDEPLGSFIYIQRVTEGVHVARDLGSALPVPLVR